MSETNDRSGDSDEFDLLDALREDPPRIRGSDDFGALARLCIGNLAFVHSVEERPDGRLVAYFGVTKTRDTSIGAGEPEYTFLNYAPIGAAVAHPTDDGEYTKATSAMLNIERWTSKGPSIPLSAKNSV